MIEASPAPQVDPDDFTRIHFTGGAMNTDIRTYLYETRSFPRYNFHQRAIGALGLKGDERVADYGCGSGRVMRILKDRGHRGEITGIDNSADVVAHAGMLLTADGYSGVTIEKADMRDLPFPDSYFEAGIVGDSLHHISNPDQALGEIKRTAAPGASIVFLTRGDFNFWRQWEWASVVAKRMGFEPVTSPYPNFDSEDAIDRLSRYFTVVPERSFPQSPKETLLRPVKLKAEDWPLYSHSVRDVIIGDIVNQPAVVRASDKLSRQVGRQVEATVGPVYRAEIERQGYYLESAQDRLITCINDK